MFIDLEIQDKVAENDGKEVWFKSTIIIRLLTHGQYNTSKFYTVLTRYLQIFNRQVRKGDAKIAK